jgi:hypothetical protein
VDPKHIIIELRYWYSPRWNGTNGLAYCELHLLRRCPELRRCWSSTQESVLAAREKPFHSIASKRLFLPWGSFFTILVRTCCLIYVRDSPSSSLFSYMLAPTANRTIFMVQCGTPFALSAYKCSPATGAIWNNS